MASSRSPVALAAGTHIWEPTPENIVFQDELLATIRKHGITRLDTARAYMEGRSEEAIGLKGLAKEFTITTKAPTATPGNGSYENIIKEARLSFSALKVDRVKTYLLHAPDNTSPWEDTYKAIQELYLEGKFEKFGLSNYNATQVREWHAHGKKNGFVLPTVYQSMYSAAARTQEFELFPTLRELGFSIQAYSPLAMGFLAKVPEDFETGTNKLTGGRWDTTTLFGQVQEVMFRKPSMINLLAEWNKIAKEAGYSKAGMAYRWVSYHSALRGDLGDEMIIGASTAKQFEETAAEIEKGPLAASVVAKIDALWGPVAADGETSTLRALGVVFGGSSLN
ncbi:NADP-dependent oxidoreductase domain-containing protein [Leptodontidium sp. MPI-SDFR-AT-0119]|nr:NADP-dependent oxidoreductase domain-containing protein [Leptodontidium sp. MPI-SDFR-AT-0119]